MSLFKFKHFSIQQDKTAMKVGTDGVLLGAWVAVNSDCESILDIGTGTGLIALQLAQRSEVETIDAVEIEPQAFEQAVNNFEMSDWGDRLYCYHSSLEEFSAEIEGTYDLIVSNPPFYQDNFETRDIARNKARFTSSLSFKSLIKGASKLLSGNGTFAVIIPFKETQNFIALAHEYKLFLNRVCHVKGTPTATIKRSLLDFSFQKKELIEEVLIIEIERHQYTSEYTALVKDFYLKM